MLNYDETITLEEKNRKTISVADGTQKQWFSVILNSIEKNIESVVFKSLSKK